MNLKSINKKVLLCAIIILLFAAFNIVTILNHEMWRDEAQPWGIAVYSSFPQLVGQLKVEGCPILWFLILRFLHFIGIKFSMLPYVTFTFSLIALYFFLFYAELPIYTKIIWGLSALFNYYNPVIARNYSLVLLIVVMVITAFNIRYKIRWQYSILIALLIQTNVFSLGLCIGLLFELIYYGLHYDKKMIYASIIPLISLILCVIELIRMPGVKTYINWSPQMMLKNFCNVHKNIAIVIGSLRSLFDINLYCCVALITVVGLVLMYIMIVLAVEKKFVPIIVFLGSNLCTYFMFVIIKEGGGPLNNIVCCFLIFIISLYYIYIYIPDYLKSLALALLTILPLLTIGKTYKDAILDIKYDYSQSKNVAAYVNEYLPENSIILYDVVPQTSSVLAYIQEFRSDIKNYDIVNNEELFLHVWNKEYVDNDTEHNINKYIEKIKEEYKNVYYICINDRLNIDNLELVGDYQTDRFAIVDELYLIYKIS